MTRTRSRALLLLAAVALIAVGCRSTPDVVMWGPCSPGNDPTGTDGHYAMVCKGGEWIPVMTVEEFVRIKGGERNVVIAPLPQRPTTTTTTSTTTTSPTTTLPAPAPTITSISPDSGPVAGGTSITITGTGFTDAASVTIGGTFAAGLTVVSPTTIVATTTAHAAGAVDVTVLTSGGSGTSANGFTYVAAPTVVLVTPDVGPVAGGTLVTIVGTNFSPSTTVSFGGAAATNVAVNSSTSLTATVPSGSAGTVDVSVTNAGGTGTAFESYHYVGAPTISAVSPNIGETAGVNAVTITGTNLTGATSVTFGGTPAIAFMAISSTSITAITPAHAAGEVDVVVTTVGGTTTATRAYQYTDA